MKKRKRTNKTLGKLDKKATLNRLTKGDHKTKGKVGASGLQLARDLVVGGLVGGGLGHLIGRPGALVGVGLNGLAYYMGYPGMACLGTGMMAGGLFKPQKDPANPNARLADGSADDGGLPKKKEQFKARFKEATDSLKYNLYLDKIPFLNKKGKTGDSKTEDNEVGMLGNPSLDEIEAQLLNSAHQFQQQQIGPGSFVDEEEDEQYMAPAYHSSNLLGEVMVDDLEFHDEM